MSPSPRTGRRILWALLALAVVVRIPHIAIPPIGVHSWRQSDTAAIARNYQENGYRFGMPQVDWGGAGAGYVESEFPLYPYAAALGYRLFGVREMIPRALSVVGYLLGACALYALVNAMMGVGVALWSTAFFLFLPLNIYYSRAIMPEAWMLAASIGGIYFFFRWSETSRIRDLVCSGVLVALAALLKLPALYLALPLAYLAWLRDRGAWWRRRVFWAYGAFVIAAVAVWYLHAHELARHGGVSFGIWGYGSDKWGNWGLAASTRFWNAVLFRSLAERWLTWAALPLFLLGLFLPRRDERERLFDVWLLAIVAYFIIVARANFVHEYYQFPFMPAGVVYLGKAFARMPAFPSRGLVLGAALAGIVLLSSLRYLEYLRKEDPARSPEMHVAAEIQRNTEPGALVIAADGGNPALLYLSHRKGWVADRSLAEDDVQRMRRDGARYLAGTGPAPSVAIPGGEGTHEIVHDRFGYLVSLSSE